VAERAGAIVERLATVRKAYATEAAGPAGRASHPRFGRS
jgi:hypothetical protein